MAEVYFPFQAGAGTSVTEAYWSMMARLFIASGVVKGALNELQVYADSSGMQVKVKSGRHAIMGLMYQSDAEQIIPIAAADPANPRIDVIALRLDWVANTIAIVVLEGTPAVNPVASALTQTDILVTPGTARWEIALANVNVPAAATTIAAGNVTDARTFTGAPTSTPTAGTTARYDANGILAGNALVANGLTGATAASRYIGATASGAPTTGTFAIGDFVIDRTGFIWICTTAGTPGTWQEIPNVASFASNLSNNGYQKLPNGWIIQWMSVTISTANTSQQFTLPMTFPNSAFAGVVSDFSNSASYSAIAALGTSTVNVVSQTTGGKWVIAIGH